MQIQNQTNQALNMYKQNTDASSKTSKQEAAKNDSLEEIINNSAARVTISMNAQSILFEMNAASMSKNNTFRLCFFTFHDSYLIIVLQFLLLKLNFRNTNKPCC